MIITNKCCFFKVHLKTSDRGYLSVCVVDGWVNRPEHSNKINFFKKLCLKTLQIGEFFDLLPVMSSFRP